MAIYHFSAKVIGRSGGRSAIASAAYRAGERLHDDKLDRDHDYTQKAGVVHREILLPEGAPSRWLDRGVLWNEVEAGEKRRDAQLARDIEIALPRELGKAEAIALARDFVRAQFVARGMVADLNVHWTQARDGGEQPHAHVMLSMREVVPGSSGPGLPAEDVHAGEGMFGKKVVAWNSTELLRTWREGWAKAANTRLREKGLEAQIDHRSFADQGIVLEPQHKIGPAGIRREDRARESERAAEHRDIARRNGDRLLEDPGIALQALTQQHSTFTRHELARFVNRHTDGAVQFTAVMAKVEAAPELVRLGEDGRGRGRFTTREMLETERRLERSGAVLAGRKDHVVLQVAALRAQRAAEPSGLVLGEEQRTALLHVTNGSDLALVVGYAGTGKSAMLGVARAAWEVEGYRVRGLALSGIAAEGLEAGSGIASRTIASLEHAWKAGREGLSSRDVLVVDEAGMIGSRQMERLLSAAHSAGAKVVLIGDPEQLQAIEAGAAFRALAERHGAAEITTVRRQREDWQRDATRELATGRTGAALGRYAAAGMVQAAETREAAKAALVAGWNAARRERPAARQMILAYTRDDVRDLNELARAAMRAAGSLQGADQVVQTERGARAFAAGDRIMFQRNERGLGGQTGPGGSGFHGGVAVKNGTLGRVVEVGSGGEQLTVLLDGPGGGPEGREGGQMVSFSTRDYAHVDHGYAATVHKAQGVTVDQAHVLATPYMDRHAAYVALTRHRDAVALHYGQDDFAEAALLARSLSRERVKDTTLDYDSPGGAGIPEDPQVRSPDAELVRRYAERRGLDPLRPVSEIVVRAEREEGMQVPERAAEKQLGAQAETLAADRSRFAGLKLGSHPEGPDGDQEQPGAIAPMAAEPPRSEAPDERLVRGTEEQAPGWSDAHRTGRGDLPETPEPGAWSGPLLPAHRSAQGLDSLGRGTSPAEVDAAVARDVQVQEARGTLEVWLGQAFHDPAAAWQRLLVLERLEGGPLGAQRALRDGGDEQLGALRGKTGWFVSAAAKAEREQAIRCADAVGGGLVRLRETEKHAEAGYLRSVRAQRDRDRFEVPGLSPAAWSAVQQIEAATRAAEVAAGAAGRSVWGSLQVRQDKAIADAWGQAVLGQPWVEAELLAVQDTARRRLGEDGVRDLVREGRRATAVSEPAAGLAGIGRVLAAVADGRMAHGSQMRAAERQHEAEQERLGCGKGRAWGGRP